MRRDLRRWASMILDSAATDELQPVLPDPSFDRYARLVQSILRVPVALVSIVESDRQVFPGAVGLPPEVADERQTPLSHSFCKHVVAEQAPLVVPDARLDARVADNPAVSELGVIGYAGFPLTDITGTVIGSLCALDTAPHAWTEPDLAALEDLAAACSTEIMLREMRRKTVVAARGAFDDSYRARVLLSLSSRLTNASTFADISRALLRVAVEELDCMHAGIWVIDTDDAAMLRYVPDPDIAWPEAAALGRIRLDTSNPVGAALVDNEALYFAGRSPRSGEYAAVEPQEMFEAGSARTFLPLVTDGVPYGTLVLVWPDDRQFSDEEQLTIGALMASTASAVQRAWLLDDRATVAAKLQRALLSDLPQLPGVEIAGRYRAARVGDQVGGDWYDAVALPSGAIGLTIGDVVGHDVDAAAEMGPVRNMLRAFAWDHDDSPAGTVTRLDRALRDLHPGVLSTVLFARVGRPDDDGSRLLTWTNAGHPAPVLLTPDGRCETLSGAQIDCLLGFMPEWARHDHDLRVMPGTTLLLFTDGLIESRAADLDEGRARLITTMQAAHGRPLDELVDVVVDAMIAPSQFDDVAVLAVRFS